MITVEMNQAGLKGGQRLPQAVVKKITQTTQRVLKTKQDMHASIAFVSDKEIKKLNKLYRGKNCVTDVLAFNLSDSDGEILISYTQAKRQAKEVGHSTRSELIFLIVHGLLHLFGYDHMKAKDKAKMFALQAEILSKLNVDPHL